MTSEEKKEFSLKVTQASKTGLIVIMYEIAAKYIEDGSNCIAAGDFDGAKENLSMGRRTINSLMSSLDMQYEISAELRNIYIFMNNELVLANIRRDNKNLMRIVGMLGQLKDAFNKISSSDKSGPVMGNTEKVYAGLTYSKSSLNESTYSDINRGYKV